MVQQALPRIQIPFFDGYPSIWVEFIVKFQDLLHQQKYLTNIQRITFILQHLHGEAKRSVEGFTNDKAGYIAAKTEVHHWTKIKGSSSATLKGYTQ